MHVEAVSNPRAWRGLRPVAMTFNGCCDVLMSHHNTRTMRSNGGETMQSAVTRVKARRIVYEELCAVRDA